MPISAKKIYLDYAATTPTDPEVLKTMLPYFSKIYGNPESLHSIGLEAKQAADTARNTIAEYLNCNTSEIVFTGSGTESNNLAIIGTARANKAKGDHLITSKIEHPSVLNTFKYLEKEGFKVTYLNIDKEGFIDLKQLENSITKKTILVSIMFANNEIGTIEPIEETAKICHKNNIIFHTDACQVVEYLKLDIKKLNIDLLTINGSKIYGPKGTGLLFIRKGTKIEPIFKGGNQEHGIRAGTHNIPGIVGLAKAFEIAQKNCEKESERSSKLRDYFIENILKKIPDTILNGPICHSRENGNLRLPNNINISIPKIEGKDLLLQLDHHNICVSTGSACNSGKNDTSHVLSAIGQTPELAKSSIRISLGKYTTKEELDYVLEIFPKIVEKLKNNK
ncbi:MAG: cysteine desulfurase family protein [Candidatus Gracilibacteria bacterium]|jgi:cysteine desulfurase